MAVTRALKADVLLSRYELGADVGRIFDNYWDENACVPKVAVL